MAGAATVTPRAAPAHMHSCALALGSGAHACASVCGEVRAQRAHAGSLFAHIDELALPAEVPDRKRDVCISYAHCLFHEVHAQRLNVVLRARAGTHTRAQTSAAVLRTATTCLATDPSCSAARAAASNARTRNLVKRALHVLDHQAGLACTAHRQSRTVRTRAPARVVWRANNGQGLRWAAGGRARARQQPSPRRGLAPICASPTMPTLTTMCCFSASSPRVADAASSSPSPPADACPCIYIAFAT
jgi:hypothetical protein